MEAGFKWLNPFYRLARSLTGIKNFTSYQQKLADNGQRVRNVIVDYVKKRKNGQVKSQVPNGVDILSFFL